MRGALRSYTRAARTRKRVTRPHLDDAVAVAEDAATRNHEKNLVLNLVSVKGAGALTGRHASQVHAEMTHPREGRSKRFMKVDPPFGCFHSFLKDLIDVDNIQHLILGHGTSGLCCSAYMARFASESASIMATFRFKTPRRTSRSQVFARFQKSEGWIKSHRLP